MSAFKAWFRSLVFNQENMELSFKQCWDAAIKSVEQNSDSEQQLKAKIAALITDIGSPNGNVRHGITIREVIERLRQLSAI